MCISYPMFSANHVDIMNTRYHELRGSVIRRQRRSVQFTDLNADQKLAHNMVIDACVQGTDNGNETEQTGVNRLQMLLGAGGCGKSYVIDSVITTLVHDNSWTEEIFPYL